MILFGIEHTDKACPMCHALVPMFHAQIRLETVLPLPASPRAPLGRTLNKPICFDCAAAEGLMRVHSGLDFVAARIAVGNDRQEQLRLPGAPFGLVAAGLMRPSCKGDLATLHAWQKAVLGDDDDRDAVRKDYLLEKGRT